MKEKDFKIVIEGNRAEQNAKELSEFITKEFGISPARISRDMLHSKDMVKFDLMTAAAVILAVPSAILSIVDLVERRKKKKKLDALVQWAKDKPGSITIIFPEGTTIQLNTPDTDSSQILDAV